MKGQDRPGVTRYSDPSKTESPKPLPTSPTGHIQRYEVTNAKDAGSRFTPARGEVGVTSASAAPRTGAITDATVAADGTRRVVGDK